MQKILFVVDSSGKGGSETQIKRMGELLTSAGFVVEIIRNNEFHRTTPFKSGKPYLRWRRVVFYWNIRKRTRAQEQVDVVTLLLRDSIFVRFALLGREFRFIQGHRSSGYITNGSALKRLVHSLAVNLSSRFASLILCNSQSGIDELKRLGIRSKKLVFLPNSISSGAYYFDPEIREAARAELGLNDDEVLITMASRLHPMKGHSLLLRALAKLPDGLDFQALIVGREDGITKDELRQIADKEGVLNRVLFRNETDDVNPFLNASDVVVCNSIYGEGSSNILAEALLTGCTVASSTSGDVPKEAATIGDPTNPEEVAFALLIAIGKSKSSERAQRASTFKREAQERDSLIKELLVQIFDS